MLEVSTSQREDVFLLHIKGDVSASTGGAIEEAYDRASKSGAKKILLLFTKEGYINSGGIAVLIGIAAESRKRGQVIRITGLSDHFRKIFHMVGLTKYTQVYPSEETALKDFHG
jgi:anti-anti-sigma factor